MSECLTMYFSNLIGKGEKMPVILFDNHRLPVNHSTFIIRYDDSVDSSVDSSCHSITNTFTHVSSISDLTGTTTSSSTFGSRWKSVPVSRPEDKILKRQRPKWKQLLLRWIKSGRSTWAFEHLLGKNHLRVLRQILYFLLRLGLDLPQLLPALCRTLLPLSRHHNAW